MTSAYGTWRQWKRRVLKAGSLHLSVDGIAGSLPIDHPWTVEHVAHLPPSDMNEVTPKKVAQGIAERRAG